MLVKLLPSQVTELWPLYKGHIEGSLPPTGDYGPIDMNSILSWLLIGQAQLWLFKDNKEQENKGFILTAIYGDISGVSTLMIYCMVLFDKTATVDWEKEYNTLRTYGNSKGCSKLAAFVKNEKAIDALSKNFEVDTRYVYAFMNI